VPAGRSRLAGATNTVVSLAGVRAHADLPRSAEASREIALALAGLAPTCEPLADAMADFALSESIALAEDTAGALLSFGARRLDARLPAPQGPPTRAS
jgi:hypothetical protein